MPSLILALLLATTPAPSNWTEHEDITRVFSEAGVTGTFVLLDADTGALAGHNQRRAQQRFVPASTFKIPNALIGIATGAVTNVDEVLPYGGEPQWLKAWEQDMSLRQGMPVSNLPVFQELARRIGLEPMREHLARLNYGNARIAKTADDFWLIGPLAISAIEQTRFLAALAKRQLPVSAQAQAAITEIIHIEHGDGWSLYAKTGWSNLDELHLGWWVGWIERDDRIHAFALNIDMPDRSYGPKRIAVGRAALKAAGLMGE